jgi:ABC-type multidrug transport system ATPase subunit
MHVAVRNLTKYFGRVAALNEVSFDIAPGEIVAVLGANGAGKTTLLRSLAGIVVPKTGEIRYGGELFRRDRMDLRRRFFFLPDFSPVIPSMTVLRHISMVVRLYEVEQDGLENRVLELLREFEILPLVESPMSSLSRGQAYKAALVALLTVNPELWLFDEPFASGIDPIGIAAFRRHARAAASRGYSVIYTTQIVELAVQFSDRVCVLDGGRLVGMDSIERLEHTAEVGTHLRRLLDTLHEDRSR